MSTSYHRYGLIVNVICNCILYNYNCSGCSHGNTFHGPQCVMAQVNKKFTFFDLLMWRHMAIKGELN